MLKRARKIFELESLTGILLLLATITSLFIANSEGSEIYRQFFSLNLSLDLGFFSKDLTIRDWINDGLMAIFFLLIGLELKEEILAGELSSKARAMLPAVAAAGGIIVPALIFYFCNFDQPQNLRGFAIPTATDIAFAYGVICLFGKKIPKSLKVFLISLAIFDDLSAILMIAFFYAQNIDPTYLILSFLLLVLLGILNFKNSTTISFYLILGMILWVMFLKSGIHATITGVLLAMFIPRCKDLIHQLIKTISPAVNFLILPIFAFANSGVRIKDFSLEIFSEPLVLGIILGLFFGKQIGVILFSFLAIKLGLTHLPRSPKGMVSWLEFYGVAILTGIGFTMSFLIGSLAFLNNELLFDEVKIGVLFASFLSAVFGMIVIYIAHHSLKTTIFRNS